MTDLLSVPVKKGSEVDFVKPLKNLISSFYSTSDRPADFSSALSELSRTGSQALSKNVDKSLPAIELLYRYYDPISALETKIPAHEVQIPFKWKDAFDKGSLFGGKVSLTVASLGYKKVCVLFNIAAMQSQIGSLGRISDTDEELKSAAKLFQSASGIFTHLKSAAFVMGGQEPTPDLNPETLTALAALMLAQAQKMFVTKAIQDKMKDAIVAKLCVQADGMFADSLRLLQKDTVKHLWDKEWIPTIAGKQSAYSALAHYFQSQVNGINKQVGEQMSCLNHCIENLKVAQQRSGITSFFSEYVSKANRLLTEAKKDNDFIYHERIPEASNLSIIDKVASVRLARPIPVGEKLSTNFKDLFDELVPVAVHQAMASCDVCRTDMTNSQIGQLREATQLLNSILASLNLPHALEDAQTSADVIPPSLIEKSRAICEAGGASGLQRSINEMPELVQRNKEILDEAERMLREEEESDDQLRAQLKEKLTRTPSNKLNGTFKTNATRYREIINNALSADEVVRSKLNADFQAVEVVGGGEAALAQFLPKDGSAVKAQGSKWSRDALKELMVQVESLRGEREVMESEIKNLKFDFKTPYLTALAQNGAVNEPALSMKVLSYVFAPFARQVKDSLEKQEHLIGAIQQKRDENCGRRTAGEDNSSQKEQVMRQLAKGFDAFTDLQNNVKKGTEFRYLACLILFWILPNHTLSPTYRLLNTPQGNPSVVLVHETPSSSNEEQESINKSDQDDDYNNEMNNNNGEDDNNADNEDDRDEDETDQMDDANNENDDDKDKEETDAMDDANDEDDDDKDKEETDAMDDANDEDEDDEDEDENDTNNPDDDKHNTNKPDDRKQDQQNHEKRVLATFSGTDVIRGGRSRGGQSRGGRGRGRGRGMCTSKAAQETNSQLRGGRGGRGRGARGKRGASACDPMSREDFFRSRLPQNNHNICEFCETMFEKGGQLNFHIRYECPDLPKTNVVAHKQDSVFRHVRVSELDGRGVYPQSFAKFVERFQTHPDVMVAPNTYFSFLLDAKKKHLQCSSREKYRGKALNRQFELELGRRLAEGSVRKVAFPCFFWSPQDNRKHVFEACRDKDHSSLVLATVHSADNITAEYFDSVTTIPLYEPKIRSKCVQSKLRRIFGCHVPIIQPTNRFKSMVNRGCVAVLCFWISLILQGKEPTHPRSVWIIKGLKEKLQDMLRVGKPRTKY